MMIMIIIESRSMISTAPSASSLRTNDSCINDDNDATTDISLTSSSTKDTCPKYLTPIDGKLLVQVSNEVHSSEHDNYAADATTKKTMSFDINNSNDRTKNTNIDDEEVRRINFDQDNDNDNDDDNVKEEEEKQINFERKDHFFYRY